MKLSSQRGVALVITLIFLSIITFLAVAFLATSRRDKSSMSATQNQTGSKLMADVALARAQAEILGKMMARSNLLGVEMMVSRNYINPAGFNTAQPAGQVDTNNVNYDYTQGGAVLNPNQFIQNVANLFFDPRPPVFVKTNKNGSLDFPFYLDLNRNGRFETNGFRRALDRNGNSIPDGNGGFVTNFLKGDPEWIGVLARPEFPHSSSNHFVGRFSFVVVPTGLTLDVNYLHNQAKQLSPIQDGFFRNQGFGSWELNLAAFLRDLNTNTWGYSYNTNLGGSSISGGLDAFDDARTLLSYRYNGTYNNLSSFNQLFSPSAGLAFQSDGIDGYGDGPLLDTLQSVGSDGVPDVTTKKWSGSDSPRRIQKIEDLLVLSKIPVPLATNLVNTLTNRSSYDQSTFYRLMEQLGTESTLELRGKMNLNYTNNLLLNAADTNFVSWTPGGFFTNAADLLLRSYTNNLSITNIQIFPTNQYTPAVHRLLQLAANIYDASTNRTTATSVPAYPYFPSVFRPTFRKDNNNAVFISGYVEEPNATFLNYRFLDLVTVASNVVGNLDTLNIYGIPCVIGAKKGLPNFNEYSLQTGVRVTRKLQFLKLANASTPYRTNQMYIFSITNFLGVEAWNSYTQAFPRAVQIIATNFATVRLTNENGTIPTSINPQILRPGNRLTLGSSTWSGFDGKNLAGNFQIPILTYMPILPVSRYRPDRPPNQIFDTNLVFDATATGFPVPNIGVVVSNRLVFAIVDTLANRVLDMVSLGDLRVGFNINEELNSPSSIFGSEVSSALNRLWRTNRVNGSASINAPTEGIAAQIDVGLNIQSVTASEWTSFNAQVNDKDVSIVAFKSQMTTNTPYATNFYSPFEPTVVFVKSFSLQANDPLVHYTAKDLTDPKTTNVIDFINPPNPPDAVNIFTNISLYNIGKLNTRYSPWINPLKGVDPEIGFDPAFKDPLIYNSDNWDFPTNKFPGVGWLGRVHRGTPWQTVYLKSAIADPQKWVNSWVGTLETHPTNDWRLVDLFTVAPNDNAARGLLSVNQTGPAAWAAGLGGVVVFTNSVNNGSIAAHKDQYTPLTIEPASRPLATIVDGINKARAKLGPKTFRSVGEILAVPELTIKSPYLNPAGDQSKYGISDAAYEIIPQQVLSLLKLGDPRFVVYSYGQSLKPLNVYLGSTYFNMVTNYQITGEVATKTVLRVQGGPNGQYDPRNPRVVIESYTVLPAE